MHACLAHRWNHLAVTRLVNEFEVFDFRKDFPHVYRYVAPPISEHIEFILTAHTAGTKK